MKNTATIAVIIDEKHHYEEIGDGEIETESADFVSRISRAGFYYIDELREIDDLQSNDLAIALHISGVPIGPGGVLFHATTAAQRITDKETLSKIFDIINKQNFTLEFGTVFIPHEYFKDIETVGRNVIFRIQENLLWRMKNIQSEEYDLIQTNARQILDDDKLVVSRDETRAFYERSKDLAVRMKLGEPPMPLGLDGPEMNRS